MENQANPQVVKTEAENVIQQLVLPRVEDFRKSQELVVKENPFVAIKDTETLKGAKKARTALRTARTKIQNDGKILNTKINEFKAQVKKVQNEIIDITLVHENKQQAEIDRWDELKKKEKEEKLRLAEEEKQRQIDAINAIFKPLEEEVETLVFSKIEACKQNIGRKLREAEIDNDFGEHEDIFLSKRADITKQLSVKIDLLKKEEAQRVESERIAKEREEIAAEKARLKAEKEKLELAEQKRKAEEAKKQKAAEDKLKAEQAAFLKEKQEFEAEKRKKERAELEAKRLADKKREEEEKAAKEAEEKAQIKAAKEAEEKRQLAMRPDKEKLEAAINKISFVMDDELETSEGKLFKDTAINLLEVFKKELIAEIPNL